MQKSSTMCKVENKIFDSPIEKSVFDVERMAYFMATQESAIFFQEHMRMAMNLITSDALLEYALSKVSNKGLILEFGVATGRTLEIICRSTSEIVYGFDNFEGLPEDWTHFQKKGRFSSSGVPPENLPSNSQLEIGLFEQTLPKFLQKFPNEKVSFVHIDSDLYSSAKCILTELAPHFAHETVIVFDEYFNYPGWKHHEYKAFNEYLENSHFIPEYIGFASSAQSVAIMLLDKCKKH